MSDKQISRRVVLKAGAALGAATVFAQPLKAAAPPPSAVTPALVDAAKKEGKASFYTALELNTSEKLARAFEAKYPGHRHPSRALRRRARVPTHRPGTVEPHFCR